MTQLSTNLDASVDVKPRVAGIVQGSIANDWVFCPFKIGPAPRGQAGCVWEATFNTLDTKESRVFSGAATTREHAVKVVTDILTSHMTVVASDRVAQRGLQIVDYGGVTAKAPGLRAWFRRLWARIFGA